MQYLLDTNICVFFLRGKYGLNEKLKEIGLENCFVSEVTVFELKFGAEKSERPEKSHKAVDNFISGLTIIPIYGCIKKYAKEKVHLNKIGKPMNDEFDLLIGITAVSNKLKLVTDNTRHFINIRNIKLENWAIKSK